MLTNLVRFDPVRKCLLQDDEVYKLKKQCLPSTESCFFFSNVTYLDEWKLKLLNDKQFIVDTLALPENGYVWDIFINIAQHPDAKTILPKDVIAKANKSNYTRCIDLCALLCSENDLNEFKLNTEWIESTTNLLEIVIKKGTATKPTPGGSFVFGLSDLLPSIANLSVVDAQKEPLGKRVVPLLMQIVTETLRDTVGNRRYLTRGRQEASRALWNFAYLESNRKLISDANGIQKLKEKMEETEDPILKKNISGILYMFNTPPAAVSLTAEQKSGTLTKARGHVMISYNWENQPLVIRISKLLKERGYNIWLDIERMGGSTLEAMASAIEQAELVLICMSQKYKDSPNCRLEGEYCVNRRVAYVPLMMQAGYKPDGWLGIALGSKLYYDFTNEENWDAKMAELIKAIGDHGRGEVASTGHESLVIDASHKKSLVEWTEEDMYEWMKSTHIDHHRELFKKHKLDGRALQELKRLHTPNSPHFFIFLCQQMGITEGGEILRFSAAVHKLQ